MSTEETRSSEKVKRLNRLIIIGAICGLIPGLIGGSVSGDVLNPIVATLWGGLGGALAGMGLTMVIITRAGLDKPLPAWWIIAPSIIGGVIGQFILVKIMGWIYQYIIWSLRFLKP